jgi:hypothetical protein
MQKYLKYIALVFFGFLWFLGCSKTVSKTLFEYKILKDEYRYGDLYRLSNLPQFRVPVEVCEPNNYSKKADLALYLAGDSFTEEGRVGSQDLASSFFRAQVGLASQQLPDSKKKKILIIETVERHFRERFALPWQNWVKTPSHLAHPQEDVFQKALTFSLPYNAQLHEGEMFGFDFMLRLKELKAMLNYYLFDRLDPKVKLSPNGEHLLYYLDSSPGISSSFDSVTDAEIDKLVANVNLTYAYYQSLGFDEVILSIIPNKTSILGRDLGNYNFLIKRIEQHPDLKMPFVSILEDFERNGARMYDKGDTHWNCSGKKIWIKKINQKISDIQ